MLRYLDHTRSIYLFNKKNKNNSSIPRAITASIYLVSYSKEFYRIKN